MARKTPLEREEPSLFSRPGTKASEDGPILRGERLDLESAEPRRVRPAPRREPTALDQPAADDIAAPRLNGSIPRLGPAPTRPPEDEPVDAAPSRWACWFRREPGIDGAVSPARLAAATADPRRRAERIRSGSPGSAEPQRARPGGQPPKPPGTSGPSGGGRPPRRRPVLRWCIRWGLTLGIWCLIAVAAVVAYYGYDLPDVGNLDALTRKPSVTLVGTNGQPFATFGDLYYDVVPLAEMPRYLPEAVIATEDRRFYDHFGIDPIGMARAVFEDLRSGQVRQGGSTITQQLAKNLFLTPERTIKRKVQEVMLALWLEHKFTKDQILTIYLNRVYLGSGAFGVEAASEKYFGKSARHVSLYEAAVLAGLLKAPSRFNPATNPSLTAQRAAQVLQNMVEVGDITEAQATAAMAHAKSDLHPAAAAAWRGRYFADWTMDQIKDLLGYIDQDITVVTTLDPHLQQLAEDAVSGMLDKAGARYDVEQGALVALAPDGAIRALVGGRDYRTSQFDRATQALRQPGSAFKPFVYLAGLESGYTPDQVFDDTPLAIGKWHPNNYDDKYYGRVTLREALAHSLNSVAIQLAEKAGVNHVIQVARRLGITSDLRSDASIALGTSEVTLLQLTAAYGSFDNGGIGVWPYGIVEIRDRAGHVLYRRAGSGPNRVMTAEEAGTMTSMMEGVIQHGTGRNANIGRPAAGKTGTTQDYKDAWFVGFTPQLVCGVWVGNDDGTPMKRVTGGRLPAEIWHNFMMQALAGAPVRAFAPAPAPPSALERFVNSLVGGTAGSAARAGAQQGNGRLNADGMLNTPEQSRERNF